MQDAPRHGSLLSLEADGAELRAGAVAPADVSLVTNALADQAGSAGVRLRNLSPLDRLLGPEGAVGSVATGALPDCKPVRAVLFDKSEATNWSLGWHQDRTIVVRERVDTPGYGPWTAKAGMHHVAPPPALLARMITLRVHLDPVDADNAPLLVAPGSHRLGRVAEADIADAVARRGFVACLASAGDVWVYSTLILHASEAAATPRRRRVLQVDYSADVLPGELEWLGV